MIAVPGARAGAKVTAPAGPNWAVPMTAVPMRKVMVPVGAGPLAALTVMSSGAGAAAAAEEDRAAVSDVVVGMVSTTWLMAADVDAALAASPE